MLRQPIYGFSKRVEAHDAIARAMEVLKGRDARPAGGAGRPGQAPTTKRKE
jgi:hypothetical protein